MNSKEPRASARAASSSWRKIHRLREAAQAKACGSLTRTGQGVCVFNEAPPELLPHFRRRRDHPDPRSGRRPSATRSLPHFPRQATLADIVDISRPGQANHLLTRRHGMQRDPTRVRGEVVPAVAVMGTPASAKNRRRTGAGSGSVSESNRPPSPISLLRRARVDASTSWCPGPTASPPWARRRVICGWLKPNSARDIGNRGGSSET